MQFALYSLGMDVTLSLIRKQGCNYSFNRITSPRNKSASTLRIDPHLNSLRGTLVNSLGTLQINAHMNPLRDPLCSAFATALLRDYLHS